MSKKISGSGAMKFQLRLGLVLWLICLTLGTAWGGTYYVDVIIGTDHYADLNALRQAAAGGTITFATDDEILFSLPTDSTLTAPFEFSGSDINFTATATDTISPDATGYGFATLTSGVLTINATSGEELTFTGFNNTTESGGVVSAYNNSGNAQIVIGSAGKVNFLDNTTDFAGGALFAHSLNPGDATVLVGVDSNDTVGEVGTVQGNAANDATSTGGFISASSYSNTTVTLGANGIYGGLDSSKGNHAGKAGGLIFAASNTGTTVTIGSGSSFYNNTTTGANNSDGGAIYALSTAVDGSTTVEIGAGTDGEVGEVKGNASDGGSGGFIHADSNNNTTTVTLGANGTYGDDFDPDLGNTAGGNGGLIYANATDATNVTIGSESNFYQNRASGSGGAIYATSSGSDSSTTVKVGEGGTVGTVQGNAATRNDGGFIFANSPNGNTSVTLGDSGTYGGTGINQGNSATVSGGLIYAFGKGDISVTIGSDSDFYQNRAGKHGGAIYAQSTGGGNTTVNVGAGTDGKVGMVQGNKNQGDLGGFIYATSNGGTTSVTLGANGTYGAATGGDLGNSASRSGGLIYAGGHSDATVTIGSGSGIYQNSAGMDGGAIYSHGSVKLSGNTLFQGNHADDSGGAIFMYGDFSNSTLDLDTAAGDIAFSGNYVGPDNAKVANSVFLRQNTGINLHGDHSVFFNDPVNHGNTIIGNNKLDVNLTGTDSFVQFLGDPANADNFNKLNRTGVAGGAVTVTSGSFRLAGDDAKFQTLGNDASFIVKDTASLAGSGTLEAEQGFILQGATLSPDSATFTPGAFSDAEHKFTDSGRKTSVDLTNPTEAIGTLAFTGDVNFQAGGGTSVPTLVVDLEGNNAISTPGAADLLEISGTATLGAVTTVQVQTAVGGSGRFLLIDANSISTALGAAVEDNFTLDLNTHGIDSHYNGTLAWGSSGGTDNQLWLTLQALVADLTWTGAGSDLWNTSTSNRNWQDDLTGNPTYFETGNNVTFDSAVSGSKQNIRVDPAGVTFNDLTLKNGPFNFSGGPLNATGNVDVQDSASLGLALGSAPALAALGSLDFNTNGALNLTGYSAPAGSLGTPETLITTQGGIDNFSPGRFSIAGAPSVDFLTASAFVSSDGNDLQVVTGLSWYSTNPARPAHGTFTINGAANSFTLGTPLADQAANPNRRADWDGKSLSKMGDGTLVLTGANSYTGPTTVAGGTMALTGSGSIDATSALVLQNGSRFDFSGRSAPALSFPRLEVTHPGATIVAGSNTLDLSGRLLAFNLDHAAANSTLLTLAGNPLLLSDTTTLSLTGLPAAMDVGNSITLVAGAAGSITKQFHRLSDRSVFYASLAGSNLLLTYDGRFTFADYLEPLLDAAGTSNENIHNGLAFVDDLFDRQGLAASNPGLARQLDAALDYARTLAQRDPALAAVLVQQIIGAANSYANTALSLATSEFTSAWKNQLQTHLMQNLVFPELFERLAASPSANASLAACSARESRLWSGGLGAWAKQNSRDNLPGYKYDSQGVALGFEYQWHNRFALGIAAAYTRGDLEVRDLRYENRPDILNLALYGAYANPNGLFLQGGLGYAHAWNRYDLDLAGYRNVQKHGNYGSDQFSADLELGYVARLPEDFNLIPSLAVEYHHLRNSGWTESVTGLADVPANRFDSASDNHLAFPIGVRFNKLFPIGCDGYLMPEIRAAFVPVAVKSRPFVNAGYAGASGSAPMVGVNPGDSYWRLGAGLSGRLNRRVDFRVDYDLDTRSGYRSHNLTASVGLSF